MRHYNPLVNYAYSFLKNNQEAEDMVQDVFFHLWNKNETLTLTGKMQTYLFTAVRNKVFEHKRADKAYKAALNGYKQGNKDESEEQMSSLTSKYMRKEEMSSLLRHLPPKCKKVFALHKLNGLTYAEIAASEGISIKTVENHMLKAMKILRQEYSKS